MKLIDTLLTMATGLLLCACMQTEPQISTITPEQELTQVLLEMKGLERPPDVNARTTGRVCKKSDWNNDRNGTWDTVYYDWFYLIRHVNRNGYWHNPKGGFALTYVDSLDRIFIQKSYNNQKSEDVVQKGKGGAVRYPSSIRYYHDEDYYRVVHKQNAYETDIVNNKENIPAVYDISMSTGDTLRCTRYDCAKPTGPC